MHVAPEGGAHASVTVTGLAVYQPLQPAPQRLPSVPEREGVVTGGKATVPESAMVVLSPAAMFVATFSEAVSEPVVEAVYLTEMVQVLVTPAAAVEHVSAETAKSAAFVPEMVGFWTTSGPVPLFVTVMF